MGVNRDYPRASVNPRCLLSALNAKKAYSARIPAFLAMFPHFSLSDLMYFVASSTEVGKGLNPDFLSCKETDGSFYAK